VAFFNTQSKKRGFCFASFSNHLSDWKMAVHSYTAPQGAEKLVFQHPANQ